MNPVRFNVGPGDLRQSAHIFQDHLKKDHGFARDKLDIGRRKQGENEPALWRRLFIKLHPDWLGEHSNTPSPCKNFQPLWPPLSQDAYLLTIVDVNPNRDLSEVAPFNSPTLFHEPGRPLDQMRDIDDIAGAVDGGIFADDILRRNQAQARAYQIFPFGRTTALGPLSPSTSLFPPSTPYSTQAPQTPLTFAGNSQWNQSQAPQYRLFPSEQGNALSARSPLASLCSPPASHPFERYKDSDSQVFQISSNFLGAQSDIAANEHSAPSSSASSGAKNSDQSATTSVTPASQCSKSGKSEICRCKRHEDSCKLMFFEGAEKCTGCDGFFTWSRKAEPFIQLGNLTCQICRCKWHEKCCVEHREQYDAGKCIGCNGWFAFSDRVDSLLKLPDLPREVHGFEVDIFSNMVDLDNSAT
jgi:hypothetical protein